MPDIDVVINLAGATLNKRWTPSYKQMIMTSRIQSTESLVHLFEQRQHKPEVLLMQALWVIILQVYIELIQNNIKHFLLISCQMSFINGNDCSSFRKFWYTCCIRKI